MDFDTFWRTAVDQGLFWLLIPFVLVVWWGFSPRRRGKRSNDNDPENGPSA